MVKSICKFNSHSFYLLTLSTVSAAPSPDNTLEKIRESLIHQELINMRSLLQARIVQEKNEIKRLVEMIAEKGPEKPKPKERIHSPNEAEMTAMIQLTKENQLLDVKKKKQFVKFS